MGDLSNMQCVQLSGDQGDRIANFIRTNLLDGELRSLITSTKFKPFSGPCYEDFGRKNEARSI